MIERQKGLILIECDSCDQVFDGDSGEWTVVWLRARQEGWRAIKTSTGEWTHICSDCGSRR